LQFDVEKHTPPPLVDSVCVECGARVPDGLGSCDALMASLMIDAKLRVASRPNRLAIDAFALQHPRRACKSAKSYAAHLAGLCCGMEYAGSEKVHVAIQRWLSTSAERIGLARPTEPEFRGWLTVEQVAAVSDQAELEERARDWARAVWNAYSEQHDIARAWVAAALDRGRARS
jgi:hypothetical protein